MRANILAFLLVAAAGTAHAGELYRWVDQDGQVHYTDQLPPPEARSAQRKRLGDRPGDGPVPFALQQAMKNFPVTLYVAEGCGEGCKAAAAYLNRRGVPFTQKDARQEANASALMALTGGKLEVPVATVGSNVLHGFEEGGWKTTLDAAGYPSTAVGPARAAAAKPAPAPAPPASSAAPGPESASN
jgi:glutaredoxin